MNITLDNVTFTYPSGVTALRDVSLAVSSGEAAAIIGQNGAGKSTLAKHLNGLLRPTEGRVRIGDWDTHDHTIAQLARRAGYVFQNPNDQLFERTVWAEVAFGPRNLGYGAAEIEKAVTRALRQVELETVAESHPYDLHPAQRKLVALAAVLAMDTPVLLFDEPTTGHDSHGVALVGKIVESLKKEGRTLLTISHDMEFCAEHFERVVVMEGGRVVADGPAATILGQTSLLEQTAVQPPQMARLAAALNLPATPLTVADFLAHFTDHSH
jgi:energy-coupling factor transport system ATP-binding protein